MTSIFKIIFALVLTGFLFSCSQILQTVELDINTEDNSAQELFNVVEKTLTIKEAKALSNADYPRTVMRNGRGNNAQPIPEKLALKSEFPKSDSPKEYLLGVGDTVTFSRLIENNRTDDESKKNRWPVAHSTSNYNLGVGDTFAPTLIKTTKSNQQLAHSRSTEKGIFP